MNVNLKATHERKNLILPRLGMFIIGSVPWFLDSTVLIMPFTKDIFVERLKCGKDIYRSLDVPKMAATKPPILCTQEAECMSPPLVWAGTVLINRVW